MNSFFESKIMSVFFMILCVLILAQSANAAELQFEVKEGWNMVSFPFGTVTGFGQDPPVNNVLFHYNTTSGGYDFAFVTNPASIKPAYGYWLLAENDATITVTGDFLTDPTKSFQVINGWNQFGLPYTNSPVWGECRVSETQLGVDAPVNNVNDAITEGWFTNILFSYNPTSGGYDFVFANQNLPQKIGFWLRSTHDCYVIFDAPYGSLSGVVTDYQANLLDSVQISLSTDPPGIRGSRADYSTTTNAQGEYTIEDIEPAAYYLSGTKNGYETHVEQVTITAGQQTGNFQMALLGGAVSGTVTEGTARAQGDPVDGVLVKMGSIEDTTDGTGAYSLANVPVKPGQTITGTKSGFNSFSDTIDIPSTVPVTKNFELDPVIQANISGIAPLSGGPQTKVTIDGTDFGTGTGAVVTFNGVEVPTGNILSWNATQIVVIAPDGISTGNVVVSKSGVASNGVGFGVYSQGLQGFVHDKDGNPITDGSVTFDIKEISSGNTVTNSVSIADSNGSFKIYLPADTDLNVIPTHSTHRFANGAGKVSASAWVQPITQGGIIKAYNPNTQPGIPWTF